MTVEWILGRPDGIVTQRGGGGGGGSWEIDGVHSTRVANSPMQ